MILFNNEHTHAVLSFVASGHVVIFDAQRRKPLNCFETTVGSTGTRQAHAAYPAPDGSYILVANQNGKRLERIDTNFRTNTFVHNPAATLDLMTCTTPSGQPCDTPTCGRSTGRGVVLRGSAVTGVRWKDKAPFDADGPGTSDLDLTLVGSRILDLLQGHGVLRPGIHSRPISKDDLTSRPT